MFAPRALVMAAALSAACLSTTASHAGGAAILVPAQERDVPEGSQIPQRRLQQTEAKVEKYKEAMRRQSREPQQPQGPQGTPPAPREQASPKKP